MVSYTISKKTDIIERYVSFMNESHDDIMRWFLVVDTLKEKSKCVISDSVTHCDGQDVTLSDDGAVFRSTPAWKALR